MRTFLLKILILVTLFCNFCSSSNAQNMADSLFFNKMITALQTVDASEISKIVYKKVDVTLPEQCGIYSAYQVKLILKDFFESVQPDTFVFTNQYKKANENFIVGTIKTPTKDYRICLLTKLMNETNYIYQIRIEK